MFLVNKNRLVFAKSIQSDSVFFSEKIARMKSQFVWNNSEFLFHFFVSFHDVIQGALNARQLIFLQKLLC